MLVQSLGSYASLVIYVRNHRHVWCESVHAAVSAAAENPLELRTLLPAPSGLCATGSEVLTTAPKPACPRTLLPGLDSMCPS